MQKKIEQKALIVCVFFNLIMAGAGLWVFLSTGIQALFLDFFFSFIAALSAVSAIIISKVSKRKTKHYPNGLYFLEPLYAILKSLLTLFLLIFSVISTATSAYHYFSKGIGEPMHIGPVFPYAIAMVIICFSLGFFNRHQNKKINGTSTILTAESKSNFIDGILSLGVGVAVIPLSFISLDGSLSFLHFTGDFFITTILVLLSIKEPLRVLISSFRELSGASTSDNAIALTVRNCLNTYIPNSENYTYTIFKTGMQIRIQLRLQLTSLEQISICNLRNQILLEMQKQYENTEVVITL